MKGEMEKEEQTEEKEEDVEELEEEGSREKGADQGEGGMIIEIIDPRPLINGLMRPVYQRPHQAH